MTTPEGLEAACGRVLDRYEDELLRHFDLEGTREASRFSGRSEGVRLVQTQLERHRTSSWQPTERPDPADAHWGWLADRVQEWRLLQAAGQAGPPRAEKMTE